MKKSTFIAGLIVLIIISLLIILSFDKKAEAPEKTKKITIITTLFPLYDFAKNIGQDKVEVYLLLPPGTEAHSFEPKPSDIARINQSDLFIYTGEFMEPWVQDVLKGVSNQNLKIVDSSTGIALMPSAFRDEDEAEGAPDPHIWLDFDSSKKIVQTIADALGEKNPANADFYQQNADEYKNKLSALDAKYTKTLSQCRSKEIIYGGHYAFGYLARRYDLKYIAAQGISPDSEPTAKDLIALIEQIKKDNIQYIFYEELTAPKISETLADETDAKLLLLNPGHNLTKEDFENNISFISIMEKNLTSLSQGLNCKQ
ncbi:MAG: divalent manganese/zinc-binding lipoprotein [uncultured bacterium]|nr:MAG: divalent manganese/zinc-binding lipoprotein [uncultured bacterium]